jgi:putative ABC transport system permease protein
MILLGKIAFRNILRNRRRSAMTGAAVAVGALALLVFGSFTTYLFASFHTTLVQQIGHLTVYRQGYFLFGAGNPTGYSIGDYEKVMGTISNDPALHPLLNVVTPTQSLVGIAGNFESGNDTAKTFLGIGLLPADRDRMRQWNEFGAGRVYPPDLRLSEDDDTRGLVGRGVARILGLCAALKMEDCPSPPPSPTQIADSAGSLDADIAGLSQSEIGSSNEGNGMPRLDLISATASGAPNVVSLSVAGSEPWGAKENDDNIITMHLKLAQQLVYGRSERKVTGIEIQLARSEDIDLARHRLVELFKANNLDLEVRDFGERTPFFGQALSLFRSIFVFISLIIGIVVLFAVVNTMTMNVMERTTEIGTLRAMGVRRHGVRLQFLIEGAMVGALGASFGLICAVVIVTLINQAGLTWIPPTNVTPVPLLLDLFGQPELLLGTWIGLVAVATGAALVPANRAAKLPVVDALRHV